jgi:hypothetical protein
MVTIFRNIYSKEPNYITVNEALNRIKTGKSATAVSAIRKTYDKGKANELKKNLPSVCFSGKFGATRTDADLIEHSGYIVLDFDNIFDVELLKEDLINHDFIKASWVSPGGNGVKALALIADKTKHREHFEALMDQFKEIDKSGINPSRVCYESHDENIFIKDQAKPYTKIKKTETKLVISEKTGSETFDNLVKWLTNKGSAFQEGERNLFIFKLAGACCRFGIQEVETLGYINSTFLIASNDFSLNECEQTIKSAYRSNKFGTAKFENGKLITTSTGEEVEISKDLYDLEVKPKDVIYGIDVKMDAFSIFENGYESANTTFIPEIDPHFKWKKKEITLLSGIGNFGKSTFLKYLMLVQTMGTGIKWALFVPEDFPAHEFYHELTEMYCGMELTPRNPNRTHESIFNTVYDYISNHFFFIYPKDLSPTPKYIKERFLELIIKENVGGCIIDPFNQMSNDYNSTNGRDDKYLEVTLADFHRFAIANDIYFVVVAHPKMMQKDQNGNYKRPSIFDIAGGAMWNNKMDNILIYHRPERGQDPNSTLCEMTSEKIRRQKVVGKPGTVVFNYDYKMRRFFFDGKDYIQQMIDSQ